MKNELNIESLGAVTGLNPWVGCDSSSRAVMMAGHIGQAPVTLGANIRRIQTGAEYEYAKYTFKVVMPCNARIIKVIKKYTENLDQYSIRSNPESYVIYENIETNEIGVLVIPRYHSSHPTFGFKYVHKHAQTLLVPGGMIPKGTVLADSPSVKDDGGYAYGIESNVVFMSIPQVIEDGFVARRGWLKKLISKGVESRVTSWGRDSFPLNLYGDETHYKPFPDIGDRIRADGLLFCIRTIDPALSVVEMTPKAMMTPDFEFDKPTYGEPGALVTDITVFSDRQKAGRDFVNTTDEQAERYEGAGKKFRRAIVDVYKELKHRRKDQATLPITYEFEQLLVSCYADIGGPNRDTKITRTYRKQPLGDWRIEVNFEYDIIPNIGFKVTGLHGDKGVICDIWEDEDMPVDQWGNVADLIMDGDSTIKRMNVGRVYEHYINATSRQVSNQIRQMAQEGKSDSAFELALRYYETCAPEMHELVVNNLKDDPVARYEHVQAIMKDGIYLWLPPDSEYAGAEAVRRLRAAFPLAVGPVTYKGRSGNVITTRDPFIIGSMYIILLEKTGDDWSSVASPRLQHFGIPAKLTNMDKYSRPWREQPTRITGEAEIRLIAATTDGDFAADLLDMANSPGVHKAIVHHLYHTPHPTRVETIIDRKLHPRGKNRALVFVNDIMRCSGREFVEGQE